ncbi:MAG: saccharopine dehydrogenase NADP-binding domain-containing protein [Byssovorax sp.]
MNGSPQARPFDLVLWGATGFTGRLVAEHLARSAPDLRWALGGRSAQKLEAVRAGLARNHPALASLPILLADAADPASLAAMVKQARVACSTVGPFAIHGKPLVRACVEQGTEYCDSTGEPHFVRALIDEHHEAARRSSVRVVPCCGFDSVPSDLGTFMLAEHARREGRALAEVRMLLGPWRGGPSGGTVASMIAIVEAASHDRALRRQLADPYGLSPDRAHDLDTDGYDSMAVHHDRALGIWTGPFIMASINARIVRRSNALTGHAYGKRFRYSEALSFRGNARGLLGAVETALGTMAGGALASLPAGRALLRRFVPAQGEGPTMDELTRGFFKARFYATFEGDDRARLLGRVEGKQDPGYLETAKMVGESALSLARDPKRPGFEGGVLTPATAMGDALLERLRKVGMVFAVEPLG